MAVRISGPKFYAWDDDGNPLAFGKAYFYESGSSETFKDTYTGEGQGVVNTNPVILNAAGYADVYLDGAYNVVVTDADDAEIWTQDPVSSNANEEWVMCQPATYVSPTSFTVSGNATQEYQVSRVARLYDGTDYTYSKIESSSYVFDVTTVVLSRPIVVVGVSQSCLSIISPDSLSDGVVLFDSVSNMIAFDLFEGSIVSTASYYPTWTAGGAAATGGARYQIMTLAQWQALTGQSTPDGYGDHLLTNGLVASMLFDDVTVLQYGATCLGTVNDSPFIQAALNAIKGEDGTGVNRQFSKLRFPHVAGGFYRIEDTLVIDGTHGAVIEGDGAYTARGVDLAQLRWYGSTSLPVVQVKGTTLSPSNPNFLITIRDLTIQGHQSALTPDDAAPSNMALAGIYIGALDGDAQDSLTRAMLIENCSVKNCRFGIYSGSPTANNTDHAALTITACYINVNYQHGIHTGTGNTIAYITDNSVFQNGFGAADFPADNYSLQQGANVYVAGGSTFITNYTSAGTGIYAPFSADIYQNAGQCSVTNAWSDTQGFFFYQGGTSQNEGAYHPGQITNVRHYNADQDFLDNTPTSVRITAPGTVIASCMVYGDVQIDSGISGRPICSGINFVGDSTFTGSGITAQRSLINIGSAGNNAQITLGGADAGVPIAHKGNKVPNLLAIGGVTGSNSVLQYLGPLSTSSGWQVQGEPSIGQFRLLINGYFSGTDSATPLNTARAMVYLAYGGSTTPIQVSNYDPNGSASEVALSAFTNQGGFVCGGSGGVRDEVAFKPPTRASAPTYASGNHWEGCMYYDSTLNKLRVNIGASTWEDLH